MAMSDMVGIHDDWATLRANPVFRRAAVPRGLRGVLRSAFVRAVVLTGIALVIIEMISRLTLSSWVLVFAAVLFWFVVYMVQRAFCWIELHGHAATGTLEDYLNTGLRREDVFMGIAYPAKLTEIVSVTMILTWWLVSEVDKSLQIFFVVLIAFEVMRLFKPPFIFLPDAESYLRRRGPLALFFLGFTTFADLIIWFTILLALLYGSAYGLAFAGVVVRPSHLLIGCFIATMFIARFPQQWFAMWRLRRFYSRFENFDDLFDSYLMQGIGRGR